MGLGSIAFFYDLEYQYDHAGNRTAKIDHLNDYTTEYTYDYEDKATYGSCSNRLMRYEIYDDETLEETVWYYYDADGNVKRIVRQMDGSSLMRSTWFAYNGGGQVEYVVGEKWTEDDLTWYDLGYGDSEYALTDTAMTWSAARTYAQSRGGDLATLDSTEWALVATAFRPDSGTVRYWVGAEQDPEDPSCDPDCEPAGGWSWIDDTGDGSLYWPYGEPDDGGGQGHDVAELVIDDDGSASDDKYNDEDATETRYAIIERDKGVACDSDEDEVLNFTRTFAWQFRYDSPRARYMRRMLDPDDLTEVLTEWSDYDGNEVLSDFTVDSGVATTERHYFGPVSHADLDTNGDWDTEAFYHGNQIGSTEMMTSESAALVQEMAYTAFGEFADLGGSEEIRYRYAGAWGYQTNDEIGAGGVKFPFMHVGARWYDPETGRFLQRDPIGIRGGMNVYAYVRNSPAGHVDPSGLDHCPICGGGIWGCKPGCKPPKPPSWMRPLPPKPPSPQEELDKIQKEVFFIGGACGVAGWPAALGAFLSAAIDQLINWGDPLNPIFGGSYGKP